MKALLDALRHVSHGTFKIPGHDAFAKVYRFDYEQDPVRPIHLSCGRRKFADHPEFADYFEMRDLIATREYDLARDFTGHLIGYGPGRPFGFTDEDLAIEITETAKARDYSVSELIQALVQSGSFRGK